MNPFTYYFQRTRHLCVYQYDKLHILPNTLFFPYVTKLTLIDCSRKGISHLLYSQRFPKLQHIYYLSGHPDIYNIYERFPNSVKWVFPNRDYSFYNCMLEAGHGEKNNDIISANIYSKSATNHELSFTIHIPGYGPREGPMYKEHMYDYFHNPHVLSSLADNELIPEDNYYERYRINYIKTHRNEPFQQYNQHCLEQDFFNHIIRNT
jgi:hypothetical protein